MGRQGGAFSKGVTCTGSRRFFLVIILDALIKKGQGVVAVDQKAARNQGGSQQEMLA